MSDLNVNTQNPPQPDPEAMAKIMAKVARVQKILGVLTYGQLLLGLVLLSIPLWAASFELQPFAPGLMLLSPFLFGLAYAANFAKKDLTFARVVFRNTAISQLGFFLLTVAVYLFFSTSIFFLTLIFITLILGALPAIVIYQALKEQG